MSLEEVEPRIGGASLSGAGQALLPFDVALSPLRADLPPLHLLSYPEVFSATADLPPLPLLLAPGVSSATADLPPLPLPRLSASLVWHVHLWRFRFAFAARSRALFALLALALLVNVHNGK